MLRISHFDTAEGQRWSLCGRLAGPWVDELRSSWQQARERAPVARALVDLRQVTFIDEGGERLLAEIERSGAEIVAGGVANKHLVESLKDGESRPLRRRLEDLCARCEREATPEGEKK